MDLLTFGVITGQTARGATATVECIVGLILVPGRLPRPGLALLAFEDKNELLG